MIQSKLYTQPGIGGFCPHFSVRC